MHTFAFQRIQIYGQCCDQGFTLTRTHFCNAAGMQGHPADQLHIEMTHAHDPLACLANRGKGLRQQLVEAGAISQPLTKFGGFLLQLLVSQCGHLLFQRIDGFHHLVHTLDFTFVFTANKFSKQRS